MVCGDIIMILIYLAADTTPKQIEISNNVDRFNNNPEKTLKNTTVFLITILNTTLKPSINLISSYE